MQKRFGTAPVFFTTISTILGAILFLRFGWAVGTLGFMGGLFIILLGHLVSIPASLAVSEIATNRKVEGGGVYYIISRSFGRDIGGTIGFVLYLSQAISVAFYVVASVEGIEMIYPNMAEYAKTLIAIGIALTLTAIILWKGAKIGMGLLYFVVAALAISLVCFFFGSPIEGMTGDLSFFRFTTSQQNDFFTVFAICFPAFTGMAAGIGLSGDLKRPEKAIPRGTMWGTLGGMAVYLLVVYKFFVSAPPELLTNPDNDTIMSEIALWGIVTIPIGLIASTLSSAIASIIVAPRTMQALGEDDFFPDKKMNDTLATGTTVNKEPVNATLLTGGIALIFILIGDINTIAGIITMFFLVTYASLCLISFLHHFSAEPSYRPSFQSRWYISLIGFLVAIWVMFRISVIQAIVALFLLVFVHWIIMRKKESRGIAKIFLGVLMQINRYTLVILQKLQHNSSSRLSWKPSAICISDKPLYELDAYHVLNWLSHSKGFGTYLYFYQDFLTQATHKKAEHLLRDMRHKLKGKKNNIYISTIISPSFTSAMAQAVQLPSVSGMSNNMILLEYCKNNPTSFNTILETIPLSNATGFDMCVACASQEKDYEACQDIHVWLRNLEAPNSNMMILLSFIIGSHKDFKGQSIKLFTISKDVNKTRRELVALTKRGRLPIRKEHITILKHQENIDFRKEIAMASHTARLTLLGFIKPQVENIGEQAFAGFEDMQGDVLFVCSSNLKKIKQI